MATKVVKCNPCMVCGMTSTMAVDEDSFYRWQAGELIQNAFPGLSAPDRELLKTGTHPECWKKMFS